VRSTAAEMWNFGRWILPSALFFPLITQVQMLWTSALIGLGSAGVLRALQNPVLPVVQVQTALGTLGLPVLAREFATGHTRAMLRRSAVYIAALGGVALLYEIAVLVTGGLWDRLLYGGKFATYDWLMPILGIMPVAVALATGCSVVLRAMLRPGLTTVTHIVGGVFGLIISYFWIRRAGVTGAVYALTASQVVTAAISLILISVAFRITKTPVAESKTI
jgi:O-antigen/teichoic acid export membrane protein